MAKQKSALSMYSRLPFTGSSHLELDINFKKYDPGTHFLLHGLDVHFDLVPRVYLGTQSNADLSNGSLKLGFPAHHFIRAFFGFNPSKNMAKVLGEMVSSDDDRSLQILSVLSDLDNHAIFAYQSGNVFNVNPRLGLSVKKRHYPKVMELLPASIFSRSLRLKACWSKDRFGPIQPSSIYGRKELYYVLPPLVEDRLDLNSIQNVFLDAEESVFVVSPRRYNYAGFGDDNSFPPKNLEQVKCFPYKSQRYRDFFEEDKDTRLSRHALESLAKSLEEKLGNGK